MKTQDQKPSFGRVVDMVLSLNRLDVPVYAANAAYFIILAAFPTVMLLLNLLSYTSLGGGALLEILEKVIPSALMPSITRLLTGMFASSSKTLVSVSALAALWAASRGIFGMLTGLNRIYNVQGGPGLCLYPAAQPGVHLPVPPGAALTLALHVFGQTILAQLPQSDNPAMLLLLRVISSRFWCCFSCRRRCLPPCLCFSPTGGTSFSPPCLVRSWPPWGGSCFLTFSPCTWSTSAIFHGIRQPVCGSHCHAVAVHLRCHCVLRRALNKYLADIGYQLRLRRWEKGPEREC